jgi:tetratricopeptide (TPR) repeat protein
MTKLNHLLISILLFLPSVLSAQERSKGWQQLLEGQFFEARDYFQDQLKTDSLQKDALEGMIVISEIFNAPLDYQKMVSRYLRHYPNDALYLTFWNAFVEDYEQTSKDDRLGESTKLEAGLQLALRESDLDNEYKENLKRYRKLFPLIPWQLIGPFKNVNGSGHIEVFPPETEGFMADATYTDESGRELSWVQPAYTAGSGRLYFDQHLQELGYNDEFTHYAQCYFELKEDRQFDIRLGRSAPIKVWVNGHEVFNDNERVRFQYDREAIEISLPAGKHSLMVKMSSYTPLMDTYDLLSFFDNPAYNQSMLSVRFTDQEGRILEDILFTRNAEALSQATPESKASSLSSADQVYRLMQTEQRPFIQFAYCKALIRDGKYRKAETFFQPLWAKNQESVFYSYLAAKCQSFNGKIEQSYRHMSALDQKVSPVFGYLYEKHNEIDLKTEPDRFKESLDFLNRLCPDSRTVIRNYLAYYDKVGQKEERDAYITSVMEKYDQYSDWLETELSTYVPPREKFGAREELKEQRSAVRRLKKGSADDDFETAIDYFIGRKKSKKALALLEKRIQMSPHVSVYRIEKAEYLNELERYKDAIKEAEKVLTINPYEADAFELMGDAWDKMNERDNALRNYQKALQYTNGYGRSGLRSKIEKIVGASRYKSFFNTPDFNDILQEQERWMPLIEEEDAVVLMSSKDLVLTQDEQVEIYQKLMVVILTEAGADRWTQSNLRHMGNITSAKVIKPDGSENTPDIRNGYVVFKKLEKGDLIQVEGKSEYELNGIFDNELNNNYYLFYPDPVYYSKFELAIPEDKDLVYSMHKISGEPETFMNESYRHYRWLHYNLAGIENEEGVPDAVDLYRSIQISTMPDWAPVVKWYQRETYRRLELTYDVQQVLDTLIESGMSQEQKVSRIYNFITRQIKYSFVPFLNSNFIPKYPENTLSAGIGDCKDVSTLMIMMLKEVGIDAWYALVKTNNYHYLDAVPSISFDHVIVCYELNGKKHFADLTTNFYPLGVLPEMDNGAMALLIKDGETETFKLPHDLLNPNKTFVDIKIDAELQTDRLVVLDVQLEEKGAAAGRSRELITRTPSGRLVNLMVEQIGTDVYENIGLEDLKFERLYDIDSSLSTTFVLNANGFSDIVSGLHILRFPYIRSISKQPGITGDKRQNRIDLNKMLDIRPIRQQIDLHFPKGYELMELPENVQMESIFGTYSLDFEAIPNGIRIVKEQAFKRQLIEITEFESFKAFYLQLLDQDKMKIAVIKSGRR